MYAFCEKFGKAGRILVTPDGFRKDENGDTYLNLDYLLLSNSHCYLSFNIVDSGLFLCISYKNDYSVYLGRGMIPVIGRTFADDANILELNFEFSHNQEEHKRNCVSNSYRSEFLAGIENYLKNDGHDFEYKIAVIIKATIARFNELLSKPFIVSNLKSSQVVHVKK